MELKAIFSDRLREVKQGVGLLVGVPVRFWLDVAFGRPDHDPNYVSTTRANNAKKSTKLSPGFNHWSSEGYPK